MAQDCCNQSQVMLVEVEITMEEVSHVGGLSCCMVDYVLASTMVLMVPAYALRLVL
jgi:hypothetical protein